MTLNDLFAVYNELSPENTEVTKTKPKTSNVVNFYSPLEQIDRVRNVVKTNEPKEDKQEIEEPSATTFNWNWEKEKEIKEDITVPYREGYGSSKPGAKLSEYRANPNYKYFKQELDKFIENNPKYASIKDSLDYLAALESAYDLNAENHQGSGALGWFQFIDDTRKAYNKQSRQDFSKDAQQQLLAAAKHYTNLQNNIRARGGDHNDFVTMYGAWWRPGSAYKYLKDNSYDYKTKYGESLSQIRKKAQDLLS